MKSINVCDPKIIVKFITERLEEINKTKKLTRNGDISCIQDKVPPTSPVKPFNEIRTEFEKYKNSIAKAINELDTLSDAVIHKGVSGNLKYTYKLASFISAVKNHQALVIKDSIAITSYLKEEIREVTPELNNLQKQDYFKAEAVPEIYDKVFRAMALLENFIIDAGDFIIQYDVSAVTDEFNKIKIEFQNDAKEIGMTPAEIMALFG